MNLLSFYLWKSSFFPFFLFSVCVCVCVCERERERERERWKFPARDLFRATTVIALDP